MSIQYEHNMMGKTNSAESIFSQWKESSPYKQERLAILKQIDTRDWEKLIDFDEQKKFNLQSDEFLIYTDNYQGVVSNVFIILVYIFGIIFIPLFTYERYFKNSIHIRVPLAGDNLTWQFAIFFIISSIIYIYFIKLKRIFLVTNKNLYFVNIKNEKIKIKFSGLSVKNSFSSYGFKKIKDNKPYGYGFWINLFFFNQGISEKISLPNKKNRCELYILNAISFVSEKYNYALYIYPIRCASKNRQNSLFARFLIFFGPFLGPGAFLTQTHIFDTQNEDIDIRFSSREKLVSFINNRTFKNHKCKNEILSLAVQGKPVPDEELFIIEARSYMLHKYIISIHKSYIQTIYKGNILKLKIEEYKDNIFNSNKSFVFVFLYQGNRIILQAKKKDIDIPFLEIMENISGSLIPFYRTPFAEWWIS